MMDGQRVNYLESDLWKGGIQNLEKELEAYDLLSSSSEEISTDLETNPEIPVVGM